MIHAVVDNLASVEADAVVRPATDRLEPSAGAQLEETGGPQFRQQLSATNPLAIGAATVTGGGNLTPSFVIHAIIRTDSEPVTSDGVRRALVSVMHRAAAWKFRTLALPLIGAGPGDLTAKDAASIICDVLRAHTREQTFPTDISIVVESEEDKAVLERLLK